MHLAAPYVSVGRLDLGRLCDVCTERSGLEDLAHGLDQLDTYVVMASTGRGQAAAGLNVQDGLRHLFEERWLPLIRGGVEGGADQ